jgi:hypothetical protein
MIRPCRPRSMDGWTGGGPLHALIVRRGCGCWHRAAHGDRIREPAGRPGQQKGNRSMTAPVWWGWWCCWWWGRLLQLRPIERLELALACLSLCETKPDTTQYRDLIPLIARQLTIMQRDDSRPGPSPATALKPVVAHLRALAEGALGRSRGAAPELRLTGKVAPTTHQACRGELALSPPCFVEGFISWTAAYSDSNGWWPPSNRNRWPR